MRNGIVMNAPAQRIYQHACATERWPDILPHYRFVRILSGDQARRTVEMAARTPLGIPVRWRAEQINDPAKPQISFRHLGGWTRGMQVRWHFETQGAQTRVSIDHELHSPLAPIIGAYFIDPIANRTLRCIKALVEGSA